MSAIGQGPAGILGYAVKGIAGGIGLASEAIHHHKEKKKAKKQADITSKDPSATTATDNDSPPQYIVRDGDEPNTYPQDIKVDQNGDESRGLEEPDTVEQEWDLDDAQDDLVRTPSSEEKENEKEKSKPTQNIAKLTEIFLQTHPIPPVDALSTLPLPVILPQRRPKDRSRGFVRAYAPVLVSAGIDQATWLEFIELFDKASQASPWLNAINLATLATTFLPQGIAIAVSLAVQIGVKVAIEMQSRQR